MLAVYLLLVPLVELVFGRSFTVKKAASLAVAMGGITLLAIGAHHRIATSDIHTREVDNEGSLNCESSM